MRSLVSLPVAPLAAALLAVLPFRAFSAEPVLPDAGDGVVTLPKVLVDGDRAVIAPTRRVDAQTLRVRSAAASDAAALLDGQPGVTVNAAGGVSGLPSIRGLADDRLRIRVDGADITASCPNHMNPPLSYVPPGDVASVVVYPGITPVSQGGDSIGGSIVVERVPPTFAAAGEGPVSSGEIGGFYRSNGDAHGVHAVAVFATEHFSARYSGSTVRADDYRAGGDFKADTATGRAGHALGRDVVGSSAYVSHNQALDLAYAWGDQLVEAKLGWQQMPRQGFPNQRMDLLDNRQRSANLHYLGRFDWGRLDARVYRETLDHAMDFGADKQYAYGIANGMPMLTTSDTTAFSLDADLALRGDDRLRAGLEHREYRLDDGWPPSGGMMGPDTFRNIRDGERDRTAAYVEWEHRFDARWTVEVGARYEQVRMDAGTVQGYDPGSDMMGSYQRRDAGLFNAADRSRRDGHWDASAIFRFAANDRSDIAFGLSRKVRAPGLYEVYPWSTWSMAAVMNNFVGDGNGYVGNLALRPERATTVSATFDLHAPDRRWELQVTPYRTQIADYIDAVQWDADADAPRTVPVRNAFTVLKYVNQDARLYGVDVSGKVRLAETDVGTFGLEGTLAWSDGENTRTGDGLHNHMPPNARLALTQRIGGWDNALEVTGVARKDSVSRVRNELETAGYGLVDLRVSHAWTRVRLDVGVDNLFDRLHALPTGGAYLGQGMTMAMNPTPPDVPVWGTAVPGPGRSFHVAFNVTF